MAAGSRPVRICTGCGERKEKAGMIRIVADPSGHLVPDLKGNLPSRGAYVCPDAACITRAARGRLASSLKTAGGAGNDAFDLRQKAADAYHSRVLSLLGQAKKSGKFVSGTNLVEAEIRRGLGDHCIVIMAGDVSMDISEKITKFLESASVPRRVFLTKEEIGDALGKSPRSVVLVKDAGMARAIEEAVDRCLRILDKGGIG